MPYQIARGLHYCRIGSHVVFLDVGADRYFRLDDALEREFIAIAEHPEASPRPSGRLMQSGVVVDCDATSATFHPLVPAPKCSALEEYSASTGFIGWYVVRAYADLLRTRHWLRTHGLKSSLARLSRLRNARIRGRATHSGIDADSRVTRAIAAFLHARCYVPSDNSCLTDSMALVIFLASLGLASTLVIGVTLEPFSAHSWAQAGDMVLNETVTVATTYAPILAL
jgi:hypothetical protein